MFDSLRSLLELVYPPQCINCNALGEDFCEVCKQEWIAPTRCISVSPIPMWSSAHYSRVATRIILLAKENNNLAARKVLAQAIAQSIEHISANAGSRRLILIPIPSSKKMNRKRGFTHGQSLAQEVGRHFNNRPVVLSALVHNRSVRDQSEIAMSARELNLHGAYSVNARKGAISPSDLVLLIDDLITSGSSVREAVRALKSANIFPEAAISACAVGAAFRLR